MKPGLKKKTEDTTWAEIIGSCVILVAIVIGIIALIVALTVLGTWIFMVIWNFTVFEIFGGPELGMLQAFAVSMIISMIGGAFSKR